MPKKRQRQSPKCTDLSGTPVTVYYKTKIPMGIHLCGDHCTCVPILRAKHEQSAPFQRHVSFVLLLVVRPETPTGLATLARLLPPNRFACIIMFFVRTFVPLGYFLVSLPPSFRSITLFLFPPAPAAAGLNLPADSLNMSLTLDQVPLWSLPHLITSR